MKVLFFTDIHGDMDIIRKHQMMSSEVDLAVCAGDISVMESNIREILGGLNEFECPVLLIHGNHEDADGLRELCEDYDNLIFLHKGVHHVEDYIFMGYGGDGFSTNDPEFTAVADRFFKPEAKGKQRKILVTHGPPYGTKIDDINGDPRGNKSYRKFIDEIQPHIVISGHLHENEGKSHKIGRTLFLNPGRKGVTIEL